MQKIYYGENGMNKMTEQDIRDFMIMLKSMNQSDGTILVITIMMGEDKDKADKMVEFIKKNPNATESQLLKKGKEIEDSL